MGLRNALPVGPNDCAGLSGPTFGMAGLMLFSATSIALTAASVKTFPAEAVSWKKMRSGGPSVVGASCGCCSGVPEMAHISDPPSMDPSAPIAARNIVCTLLVPLQSCSWVDCTVRSTAARR
eukprot:scaffold140738_cov31-Tisochrysis_lutea.AAC.6